MPSVELGFKNNELTRLIDRFERLPDVLRSKLRAAARDIGDVIAATARSKAPKDTGDLAASIQPVVEAVGQTLVELKLGSDHPGAAAQEYGTEPGHFPPPSALRGWAARTLGDASAAYPVAKSISETGLDAQPFLRPAFEDNTSVTMTRINEAVDEAFREVGIL